MHLVQRITGNEKAFGKFGQPGGRSAAASPQPLKGLAISFRLFIYYGANLGSGGAFLGWGLGERMRWPGPTGGSPSEVDRALNQGIIGMWFGVALALGGLDAVWNAT